MTDSKPEYFRLLRATWDVRTVCMWVAETLADQPTLMHKG